MSWIEAVILGLIQGLAEFLPILSSGHLMIGSELLGLSGEENLVFTIAVHAATVLSTIVILFPEIRTLVLALFKFEWNEDTQMIAKIALSLIPIMIVGLFMKDYVESLFEGGLLLVGIMLWVTAGLLAFAYYTPARPKENLSFRDAFIIGVSQAIAILPGLSRSGTTIATGIILGNNKEKVARFSFLMVIIPILGEACLDLLKGDFSAEASNIPTVSLIAGFLTAFIVGCIACKWMIGLVKNGKLIYFSYYCCVMGTIAIVYSQIHSS